MAYAFPQQQLPPPVMLAPSQASQPQVILVSVEQPQEEYSTVTNTPSTAGAPVGLPKGRVAADTRCWANAKMVAIADLVLSVIQFIGILSLCITFFIPVAQSGFDTPSLSYVAISVLLLLLLLTPLEICQVYNLLVTTTDPSTAIPEATGPVITFWCWNLVFILLQLGFGVMAIFVEEFHPIKHCVWPLTLFRVVALVVVWNLHKDLQSQQQKMEGQWDQWEKQQEDKYQQQLDSGLFAGDSCPVSGSGSVGGALEGMELEQHTSTELILRTTSNVRISPVGSTVPGPTVTVITENHYQ